MVSASDPHHHIIWAPETMPVCCIKQSMNSNDLENTFSLYISFLVPSVSHGGEIKEMHAHDIMSHLDVHKQNHISHFRLLM